MATWFVPVYMDEDDKEVSLSPDYSQNRVEYATRSAQQEKNRLMAHNALVDAKMAPEETRFYLH